MMNKKKETKKVSVWIKLALTIMICGGTLAAFIELMLFVAAFIGWYIVAIGVMVYTIRAEFIAIWTIDKIKEGCRRPRHRYKKQNS